MNKISRRSFAGMLASAVPTAVLAKAVVSPPQIQQVGNANELLFPWRHFIVPEWADTAIYSGDTLTVQCPSGDTIYLYCTGAGLIGSTAKFEQRTKSSLML